MSDHHGPDARARAVREVECPACAAAQGAPCDAVRCIRVELTTGAEVVALPAPALAVGDDDPEGIWHKGAARTMKPPQSGGFWSGTDGTRSSTSNGVLGTSRAFSGRERLADDPRNPDESVSSTASGTRVPDERLIALLDAAARRHPDDEELARVAALVRARLGSGA